jgi:hypothetical protein
MWMAKKARTHANERSGSPEDELGNRLGRDRNSAGARNNVGPIVAG